METKELTLEEIKTKSESLLSEVKYANSYFKTNLLNKINALKTFDISNIKVCVDRYNCIISYIYDKEKQRDVSITFNFLQYHDANGYSIYDKESIEKLNLKQGDIYLVQSSNISFDVIREGYEKLNAIIFFGEIAKDIAFKGQIYECIQHYQSILTPLYNQLDELTNIGSKLVEQERKMKFNKLYSEIEESMTNGNCILIYKKDDVQFKSYVAEKVTAKRIKYDYHNIHIRRGLYYYLSIKYYGSQTEGKDAFLKNITHEIMHSYKYEIKSKEEMEQIFDKIKQDNIYLQTDKVLESNKIDHTIQEEYKKIYYQ